MSDYDYNHRVRIGRGGQATAFLVKAFKTGRKYIYKEYRKPLEFHRELAIHESIPEHPNIMSLTCVIPEKNAVMMPYMGGGDMWQEGLPYKASDFQLALYAAQLILSVEELHKAGFLHHDIKPQNLVRDKSSDHIKLIDFGLAVHISDVNYGRGTKITMAPEIARIRGYEHAPLHEGLDWWSVGATIYMLHTLSRADVYNRRPGSRFIPYRITSSRDFKKIPRRRAPSTTNDNNSPLALDSGAKGGAAREDSAKPAGLVAAVKDFVEGAFATFRGGASNPSSKKPAEMHSMTPLMANQKSTNPDNVAAKLLPESNNSSGQKQAAALETPVKDNLVKQKKSGVQDSKPASIVAEHGDKLLDLPEDFNESPDVVEQLVNNDKPSAPKPASSTLMKSVSPAGNHDANTETTLPKPENNNKEEGNQELLHEDAADRQPVGVVAGPPPPQPKSFSNVMTFADVPDFFTAELKSLLKILMNPDPNLRRFNTNKKLQLLKRHPYFRQIDWSRLPKPSHEDTSSSSSSSSKKLLPSLLKNNEAKRGPASKSSNTLIVPVPESHAAAAA